jgi:F-box and WD-40 domain protein CDC4
VVSCRTRSGLPREGQSLRHFSRVFPALLAHYILYFMDPPGRLHSKRGTSLVPQTSNSSMHSQYFSDGSPTPFTSSSKSIPSGIQNRRPRSSQTVSIGWKEEQDTLSHHTSSLDIVAECIETKTITTTTTTKRTYPSLSVSQQSLASLDSKEYPLASKDTPPELTFFKLHGQVVDFDSDEQLDLVRPSPI